MSQADPQPRPEHPVALHPLAIVASLYNRDLVDGLVASATRELAELLPSTPIHLHRVPGAYEIPVTVEKLCARRPLSAVLAFGVIIRGSTAHADLIGEAVTFGLQEIALRHLTPVIHAILLVDSEADAHERCLGDRLNRGREAARSAVAMTTLFAGFDTASPPVPSPSAP